MEEKIKSRRAFLINLAYFVVIGIIVYIVFKYLLNLIMPFVVAFILVSFINPIIKIVQSKFPDRRSVIAIILMTSIYLIIAGLIFLLIFSLLIQLSNAAVYISDVYFPNVLKPELNKMWEYILGHIGRLPTDWQKIIHATRDSLMEKAQSFAVTLAPSIVPTVSRFSARIPGFFIALIFTIMMSFVVSIQYERVLEVIKAQFSAKALGVISDIKSIMQDAVLRYLRALIILMFITLIELLIAFQIIGIKNSFFIAVIIAVLDVFPVLGTGTVLIPWALIELIQQDYKKGLGLIIIYVVITVIRRLIEPKIIGDQMDMNPIIALMSIYAGYKMIGVFGMILLPIIAQILLELHKRGTIKLFKPVENEDKTVIKKSK